MQAVSVGAEAARVAVFRQLESASIHIVHDMPYAMIMKPKALYAPKAFMITIMITVGRQVP